MPPAFAPDAVNEAIEAGIKLLIVVTEHIPRRLVAQFVEYAKQEGARIIGPNLPGRDLPRQDPAGRRGRRGRLHPTRPSSPAPSA